MSINTVGVTCHDKTEFVLEPAARRFLATVCGEFLPEIIHFLLRFAVYDEGDGFIEFEKRPAVKSDELLAFDFEFNRQHRSDGTTGFFRCFFGVAEDSADLRIFEERRVKVHGLLGLIIKPQEWSNFLHQNLCRFDPDCQQNLAFHETPYNAPMLMDTHAQWTLCHVERSRDISGLNFRKKSEILGCSE